jgi:hypothetical protein
MLLNLSSSMANLTYPMLYDGLLKQFGSTYFIDIVFLVSSCLSIIGLCLNLVSVRVLLGERFKSKKLFYFMRVYLINSTIVCVMLLPAFLLGKRIAFAHEPYGTYYICYIYSPLMTGCVFSSLIDMAIVLDRITVFTEKFDFVKKYSTRVISIISFVISLIIGPLYYPTAYPDSLVIYLNETISLRFYFTKPSQFAESSFGSTMIYLILFLKDIVGFVLLSTLNIASIVLLKRYLIHKSKMFNMTHLNKRITQQKSKSKFLHQPRSCYKIDVSNRPTDKSKPQTTSRNMIMLNNRRPIKISRTDRSATIMAIGLSLMSMIEHALIIATAFFFAISQTMIAFHFGTLLTLTYSIRHSSNFFIFLFNKNFKSVIDDFFKKYF